jgi:hypothetical protein
MKTLRIELWTSLFVFAFFPWEDDFLHTPGLWVLKGYL